MQKHHYKTWKSFDQQLELLKSRGLIINNEDKALGYLKTLGYYRLSGYLYSFRKIDSCNHKNRLDEFIGGSHFEDVRQLYVFDKKLRQLALDALERIEIAIRVNISYLLGKYDSLAHLNKHYFQEDFNHEKWLTKYQAFIKRESSTQFVKHHLEKYGGLPVWASSELWDFGAMSILYKNMKTNDKDHIARIYRLKSGKHLQTHLHAFNFIRNIAAHHGRLWNRPIVFQANLKGLMHEQWTELNVKNQCVYFCLMKRMLDIICPNSTWGSRFLSLLDEFPQVENGAVNLSQMGVTINLKDWELWK